MPSSATQAVLVTGATGNTGSALVRLLEQKGIAVRAMVRSQRDIARLGPTSASFVFADFNDADSLAAALKGVDRAYLVTPSSMQAEAQQIRFVELAAQAGIKHLVKLSQFAADPASPVRFLRYHATVERRIRELGIDFTFLRPNLFFQGFLAFQSTMASMGRFFAPIGYARISAVDVRDIAAVAASVFTQPGHIGKTYTITGPAAITHADIAAAITKAIGHDIAFIDVPPKDFADALRKTGMPPWQIGGLVEDYAHYARGEAAQVYPSVRDITGQEPRDVVTFARDYASAFAAAPQT